MSCFKNVLSLALVGMSVAGTALNASAAPLFKITEAFSGVSGSDGTPDWFELTNFGDMTGNIGTFYYDDISADPTNNYQLPNFDVAPGEAIIVMIETDASAIPVFNAFWWANPAGQGVQVGVTGGGSLGQGGDAVYVFDGNTANANVIDFLAYDSSVSGLDGTIEDVTGDGPVSVSQLGVNGAFNSSFFIGDNDNFRYLVGSPGVGGNAVPEPSTIALGLIAAFGAIAGRRRK